MFLAHSTFSLWGNRLKIRNQSRVTNLMTIEADYSIYTLPQVFRARYWIETRGSSLEEEIRKSCTYIQDRTNLKPSTAAGTKSRFSSYHLIFSVVIHYFTIR